jgi:acetyltransferase EpsM
MPDPLPVLIPLLNTNEPEALLAALLITEGQLVSTGDLLCTLETTKSAVDVTAEAQGYVAGLRFSVGQLVRAGEILCYLAESPEWSPSLEAAPLADRTRAPGGHLTDLPVGLRITQPALRAANEAGLDLETLPTGPLVTESLVRDLIERSSAPVAQATPQSGFDPTAILIYGGGGHGKMLIDLLHALKTYHIIGVLDDGLPIGSIVMGIPVLGGGEVLSDFYAQGVRLAANAVGGIGNIAVRINVFQKIAQAGFACPALVHPAAFIEPGARLSPGSQVFAHAYVGSEADIGFGVIVSTGAIVSHDCVLGECTNLAPGAILAGEVRLGRGVLIGMGVTVNLRVQVGAGARVGNGATVKADVPENGLVRAGATWPEN